MLGMIDTWHYVAGCYAECHYAGRHVSIVMLSVVLLSIVMHNVNVDVNAPLMLI
jgi:hypothetical protein